MEFELVKNASEFVFYDDWMDITYEDIIDDDPRLDRHIAKTPILKQKGEANWFIYVPFNNDMGFRINDVMVPQLKELLILYTQDRSIFYDEQKMVLFLRKVKLMELEDEDDEEE
jgi:hypothetical protein